MTAPLYCVISFRTIPLWPPMWPQRKKRLDGASRISANLLILMAPRAGFEPATIRLTVECSTAELPRNRRKGVRDGERITKPPRLAKAEIGSSGTVSRRGRNALRGNDFFAHFSDPTNAIWHLTGRASGSPAPRTERQKDLMP